jgi:hypothetical protein
MESLHIGTLNKEGIMFKKLTKAVIGVATLPIDVAADIATLGGTLTDKKKPYTAKKLSNIVKNIDDAVDPDQD